MDYTTKISALKRTIHNFSARISAGMTRPFQKFAADICYGAMAAKSCVLSEIAQVLQEDTQKINTVERLARHLNAEVPETVRDNYTNVVKQYLPENIVIHIDNSDVIKPCGRAFEGLSRVRDGSKSMDRGYDDNDVFRLLDRLEQSYVIRLKLNRKIRVNGKKYSVQELCANRRGKYATKVIYHGRRRKAKLSVVKGVLSGSDRALSIILVYGLADHPMVLATNLDTHTKNLAITAMRLYFSRWRIEEYFRCKKQMFDFENFRVRSLTAINSLNFFLSACMLFLAMLRETSSRNMLFRICVEAAAPLRPKVYFFYYRLVEGLHFILSKARTGIRGYFKTLRPNQRQMKIRGFT